MRWPWHKGTVEAEKRRDAAEQATLGLMDLVRHSREVDAALRREVARNGFGELIQIAMGGRRPPGGQKV